MTNRVRQTPFGFRVRPLSQTTRASFIPTGGFTELPDVAAPPSSIISGQNVWVKDNSLQPRWSLQDAATNNVHSDVINGAFQYKDISGTNYPVVTSQDTVAYLDGDSYTTLTYVSSGSNLPPSGGENSEYFGTSVYLERRDLNIGVFTDGIDPLFAWGGPSDGTGFSTLTQAPIAADVALFDNRPVAWNVLDLSYSSRFVTRVQWSIRGDPEDWTGIGSGSEDLVDMRGEGTRVFATEDELVLASTKELWRGRKVGLPFIFSFSPIERELGIPHGRASIQTEHGIFWLHDDFMVYRMQGANITPVGGDIQETLRRTMGEFESAHFGYNAALQHLTLYYSTAPGALPTRGFTFHLKSGAWTPQVFEQSIVKSTEGVVPSSGTTWGGLTGTLGSQELSFEQLLGLTGASQEVVFTSDGTSYSYNESATSDDGSAMTAQAVLGGVFTGDPERVKLLDEVRLDARADSASTLTVGVSGNLGTTIGDSQSFAVSVQSNTTQTKLNMGIPGLYHNLTITGSSGSWRVSRVHTKARVLGESF